ncbi:FAD-binding oxidoreductase [Flavitalea sp. BT771]|uniref:NAD(P)/FAD-dependent oxidoreductase n=1 Tax=Flavitalea sp. BT771 TaxID=3063329 RepID=UPI0026E11517|nr:FAD-binding oxidoreductase [Flavitalea sp. BT771]MDO6429157.1 FAD-binding oxidoreductase [Flavitalea sp. BT771]MDV6218715.1 FAD-binding oxidoreductase [Flavitalea sp. BT771]
MMKDVLIVGQGICGTFLSWYLEQAGRTFVVIDEERPHTASRAAAGLINPVTGRRIVKTWMIDELLDFAQKAYGEMAPDCMRRVDLIDFFPTAQMRLAFLDRLKDDPQYIQLAADDHAWDSSFHYELGFGTIAPCYLVDLPKLLPTARRRMLDQRTLREEYFDQQALTIRPDSIQYKDITARMVIFCDGIASFSNPYFSRLPFAPNKGEALILDIPQLDQQTAVFKKGITLAPWKDGLYWVGSSYEWSFSDTNPTNTFRERTEAALKNWIKLPLQVIDHFASVRPATLERRPFVGFHPLHPAVGILNGMGTKGCSLAPYFAHQLVEHMVRGKAIQPNVDVKRFAKILSR